MRSRAISGGWKHSSMAIDAAHDFGGKEALMLANSSLQGLFAKVQRLAALR
jgi:hypothetical protein